MSEIQAGSAPCSWGSCDGFVLVEQDLLPSMRTAKESALRNREYLRSIGL